MPPLRSRLVCFVLLAVVAPLPCGACGTTRDHFPTREAPLRQIRDGGVPPETPLRRSFPAPRGGPEPEALELAGDASVSLTNSGELYVAQPVCGDGAVNTQFEQCDDGDGLLDDADGCTETCRSRDVLVAPPSPAREGTVTRRSLTRGRHALAAGADGFAVTYLEESSGTSAVYLSQFDENGKRRAVVRVDDQLDSPVSFANPVVAALPSGDYAVAWTDLRADGDELGLALRRVSRDGQVSARLDIAQTFAFSQHDVDLVWTGMELVAAWVDDSSAVTAPDIRYRSFDEELSPRGPELYLAGSVALDTDVTLASTGDGNWAAAWRQWLDDTERIAVTMPMRDVEWALASTGFAPDAPVLAAIPGGTLALAFTDVGSTKPAEQAVQLALFDPSSVGYRTTTTDDAHARVWIAPGRAPAIAVTGDTLLIGGESVRDMDDVLSDVWIAPITSSLGDEGATVSTPLVVPQDPSGAQQGLALAIARVGGQPMLISAWEDYRQSKELLQLSRDIVVQYTRLSLLTAPESPTLPTP